MYKAVIFDFFDVIRSDPYNAWLKKYGYVREGGFLDASQRMDSGEIDLEQFYIVLSKLSNQTPQSIKNEFDSVAKVDGEVLDIIKRLRRSYKIGLLSNSPSNLIREILRINNLEGYFDEIVVSSEVGHIKPSKQIFEIILKRMNLDSSEVIFIDDSEHHIKGAENAGIDSIQFTDARKLTQDLQRVGVLIN